MAGDAVLPPGRWVRVHRLELSPTERAPSVPADTARVPFESWINGWLEEPARIGERARIRTPTGRTVEGELVEADPGFTHSFGSPPAPLQEAGVRARELLFGEGGR